MYLHKGGTAEPLTAETKGSNWKRIRNSLLTVFVSIAAQGSTCGDLVRMVSGD